MAAIELTVNAVNAHLNARAEQARLDLSRGMEDGDVSTVSDALEILGNTLQSQQLLQSMIERPQNEQPPATEAGTGS
jgi:hypothetical protein|tara:strand:- start:1500 stop:1730 length:231 start_codon:yes stop_codon:yes gene_type:complete